MARQDWAAAVAAFRGAMVYVPNFQDAAERLSICAARANATTLSRQIEDLVANKNYDAALPLLNELTKSDPEQDVKALREAIDCGQKYQQAVTELQRGNQ